MSGGAEYFVWTSTETVQKIVAGNAEIARNKFAAGHSLRLGVTVYVVPVADVTAYYTCFTTADT